jgi:hypothetical protein
MTMSDDFGASEVAAVPAGPTATAHLALPAIAPAGLAGTSDPMRPPITGRCAVACLPSAYARWKGGQGKET